MGTSIGYADAGRDQVLYLYGVVPAGQAVPALAAAPLEAVPFSSLAALVERVPSSEFPLEQLAQKLSRIEWFGPLAQKHSEVLEDLMRQGPVVPARLCTVYRSAGALASALSGSARRFEDALRWLGGRQEWGLRLSCDEEHLRSEMCAGDPRARELEAAARAAGDSDAPLLRRQRDQRVSALSTARIEEVSHELLDELAGIVADTHLRARLPVGGRRRGEAVVLSAALLVDQTAGIVLQAAVAAQRGRLRAHGFSLALTGPCPPYSFASEHAPGPEELDGIGGDEGDTRRRQD